MVTIPFSVIFRAETEEVAKEVCEVVAKYRAPPTLLKAQPLAPTVGSVKES